MEILGKILEAMVITLREGVEAALVVGILLAYLRKTGREALTQHVLLGLGAAVLASIIGAVVIQRYGLDPENEVVEGTVMFVAAGLVGSLVIWMWRTGRSIRGRLEQRLDALTSQPKMPTVGARAMFGVFVFTFLMVLREGVETILFLAALSGTIGGNPFYNALGGGLGLILAILFGYLLFHGSVKINLNRFFAVTGLVLLILVGKLIAGGFHEFFEVGLISSSPFWLGVVGLFTRESTSLLVLILLIALPGLCLAWDGWRMASPERAPQINAAERRKELAEFRRARRRTLTAGTGALAVSLFFIFSLASRAGRGYDPTPVRATFVDGAIRVAFPDDDKIRKYFADVEGVPVRFFLLKRKDGSLACAFDACAICPAAGYFQEGEQLICKNCDAPINEATVGVAGGCNPVPLTVDIDGQQVIVGAASLAKGRKLFVKG